MQVATLFRETAKLLGASMDGSSGMDNNKYCMKSETQADDGYETCVDAVYGNNIERMLGGPQQRLDPNMRHSISGGGGGSSSDHVLQQRQSMTGMKMEQYGDPYSFVDEMPNACLPHSVGSNLAPQVKKRGRRKKSETQSSEDFGILKRPHSRNEPPMDAKERKRHDRFNGLSEEEVSQKTLPDHMSSNLDILIIGINPGLFAAFKGHHYAGPGNHFWKCLYLSGLVPEPLTADDDFNLLHYGIGFTNMVARPTKGSADLTRREIKQGSQILLEKLQKFQPKIAVFNGKLIYEVFSGKKDFPFGRQQEFVEGTNTYIWVMPSSSARCAQLPRAADKVPFYSALKKFRDYLNGLISELDESEVVFNDSKPMSKTGANGETKLSTQESVIEEEQVFNEGTFSGKKKRGRPRKGMEKHPPNIKLKKCKPDKIEQRTTDSESRSLKNERFGKGTAANDNSNEIVHPVETQRKRRGRPKKTKEIDTSPITRTIGETTPDVLETSTPNSIGTCQTQTTLSVSSGYSTGTNSSSDLDRRREESGSLSNAGSGGPSPSHHSFTTQSDLSSEISAAISCGSPPPSPLNNQTESVFESLAALSQAREESHNSSQTNKMSASSGCRPTSNLYNSSSMGNTMEPQESSYMLYHQSSYDNRLHNLSSRSQTYQSSHSRDGNSDGSMQSGPQYTSQYETKALDVASKSLSGLESLVDQIPSIADADVGVAPVSSGGCLSGLVSDSILHSQSMTQLGGVSSSMSHSGHYMESPSGFLPYSHGPSPSYSTAASHYASSPYYASELSSSFPVNSLAPTYCSPSATSGIMFGYPGYPGQYGAAGYPHSASTGLHLSSSYGTPPGYPHAYPNPGHYSHGHPMASPNGQGSQRFTQRLHLRQDGMDLGHMGFGGF